MTSGAYNGAAKVLAQRTQLQQMVGSKSERELPTIDRTRVASQALQEAQWHGCSRANAVVVAAAELANAVLQQEMTKMEQTRSEVRARQWQSQEIEMRREMQKMEEAQKMLRDLQRQRARESRRRTGAKRPGTTPSSSTLASSSSGYSGSGSSAPAIGVRPVGGEGTFRVVGRHKHY